MPFSQHLQSKEEEKEGGNETVKAIDATFLLGCLWLILCVLDILTDLFKRVEAPQKIKARVLLLQLLPLKN